MRTIVLPRLVGTRELARDLVSEARISDGTKERAVLAARAVDVVAPSFVDELVVALKEAGVSQLVLQGASEDLTASLNARAKAHAPFKIEEAAV